MTRTNGILICCVATLLALGGVMIFSVLAPKASALTRGAFYLSKHALWVTIGIIAMLLLSRVDYRLYRKHWKWIALTAAVLLIVVLLPGIGTDKKGAQRWLRLGPVGFQPSEVAKLALLISVSAIAAARGEKMRNFWRGFAPSMALVGAAVLLVLVEPDFGTAALLFAIGTVVVLAGGGSFIPILGAGLAGVAGFSYLVWQSPTRLGRVFAFLDPWNYEGPAAYQVRHSILALGSGGFSGRGLGEGGQKLFYVPESDTDFIFSIIGEELGLLGTLGVIVAFALLVRQGMRIASRAPDAFGGLLALGITTMIALQAIIHIAVVTASMPTKGIALPFVSSGGSSMVMSLAAIGVLLNIGSQGESAVQPALETQLEGAKA